MKLKNTSLVKIGKIIYKTYPDRLLFLVVRFFSYRLNIHSHVAALPLTVADFICKIIITATILLLRINRWFFPDRYTDADPYKTIYVDPNEIQMTSGDPFSKRRGWVVDGNWDKQGKPFAELQYPKAIHQRFDDDLDWEETVLMEKYSHETLIQRGQEIDALYYNIKEKGYMSQKQLLEEDPDIAWQGLNDAMHPLGNEVTIDIGRDGEFLWNICGQHRLAIAQVLNLDQVPVQVFRRHTNWQAVRENGRHGSGEQPTEHPDLEDITD